MFPVIKELIKGCHAYPNRMLILNKKTCTRWELGVWERLIELNVCEMHETQDKKKKNPGNVQECTTSGLPASQRLSSVLPFL